MISKEKERKYHALTHASAPIMGLLGGMTFLGPMVMWLAFKDENPSIAVHGKKALNFHITMLIATMMSLFVIVSLILLSMRISQDALLSVIFAVGIPWIVVLALLQFIMPIVMAFKAYNGNFHKYPFAYPFFKPSKFDKLSKFDG